MSGEHLTEKGKKKYYSQNGILREEDVTTDDLVWRCYDCNRLMNPDDIDDSYIDTHEFFAEHGAGPVCDKC